jgi:protein disulfide-isomerase A6
LNKQKPLDYQSERSADAIVKFVVDKIGEITKYRLSGKASSSSSSGSSSKSSSGSEKKYNTEKDVIVLEDENFDDLVMNSNDMWLIEFYAPWCGHCKKLEPEWNQAGTELKGKIKVGKVDATVHQKLGSRFQIQGYPTIKIFAPGAKSQSSISNYDGARDASSIVTFALEKLEKYGIVPDVEQLTNENQLKEVCKDRIGVCIITLLPHLIDSSSKQRKEYIEQIKEATKAAKGKPIYYLWAQGADFFDFEEKLHLSFGYPAVVALNFGKKKFSVCRTSFGADNLKTYVSSKKTYFIFRFISW